MKSVILTIASLLAMAAHAETAPTNTGKFEENKKLAIENVQERMNNLTTAKGCFEAATNPEAMKACHMKMREGMKEMRMGMMDQNMDRMGKRMERMKDRKEKMQGSGN